MRMKTRQTLAALLALVMLLALAPLGYADEGGTGGETLPPSEFDNILATPNTVTVDLATTNANMNKGEDEAPYDLYEANVVVDLYKIADIVKDDKFATYSYNLSELFKNVNPKADEDGRQKDLFTRFMDKVTAGTTTAINWDQADSAFASLGDEISEVVLQKILDGETSAFPVISGTTPVTSGSITISDIPGALYLMVPHGLDDELKTTADYIVEKEQSDSEEKLLRPIARDDNYEYVFRPQLLSLPGKTLDGAGQYNTAFGTWTNTVTVILKPTPENMNGDLKIVKTLDKFAGPDPASFVFEIKWEEEVAAGKTKTEIRYAEITFDSAGKKEYTLVKTIPVGTEVTVTEIHTGLQYSVTSSDSATATIVASSTKQSSGGGESEGGNQTTVATVEFTNDHTGPGGGYGAVNRFTADGKGNFTMEAISDSGSETPKADTSTNG